jgi:hypothetical protein
MSAGITLMHCLACDAMVSLPDGETSRGCGCGNSTARLSDDGVVLNGPCRVVWIDGERVATATIDVAQWPAAAPRVIRRHVAPLL